MDGLVEYGRIVPLCKDVKKQLVVASKREGGSMGIAEKQGLSALKRTDHIQKRMRCAVFGKVA